MPLLQTWLLPNILRKKGVICDGHRDNQAIGAMTSNTKIFVFERCGINWKLQIKDLVLTPNCHLAAEAVLETGLANLYTMLYRLNPARSNEGI